MNKKRCLTKNEWLNWQRGLCEMPSTTDLSKPSRALGALTSSIRTFAHKVVAAPTAGVALGHFVLMHERMLECSNIAQAYQMLLATSPTKKGGNDIAASKFAEKYDRYQREVCEITLRPKYKRMLYRISKLVDARVAEWKNTIDHETLVYTSPKINKIEKCLEEKNDEIVEKVAEYEQESNNWAVLNHWPSRMSRSYKKEARENAQRAGIQGFAVRPSSDLANHLLFHSKETAARKVVWDMEQNIAVSPEDVEEARTLMFEYASEYECEDYASLVMDGAFFMTPTKAINLTESLAARLGKAMASSLEAVKSQAPSGGNLVRGCDEYWGLAQKAGGSSAHVDPSVFPVARTANKVITEILSRFGYAVSAPEKSGRGRHAAFKYTVRGPSGDVSDVWYIPYDNRGDSVTKTAALAETVAARTADSNPVVAIWHYLPPGEKAMSLYYLETLCHELGHAVHFLALQAATGEDLTLHMDMDYSEVPSMLLENYYRDPETLIRWSSRGAIRAAKSRRYWARRLRLSPMDVKSMYDIAYSTCVDIKSVYSKDASFEDIVKETKRAVFAVDKDYRRADNMLFSFDGRAGMWSEHVTGIAVAQKILGMSHRGIISTNKTADAFESLMDNILSKGVDNDEIERCWISEFGESLSKTAISGFSMLGDLYERVA